MTRKKGERVAFEEALLNRCACSFATVKWECCLFHRAVVKASEE